MLKVISQIMLDSCRKSDLIFRWGGDEFIILLPNTDQAQAEKLSAKIKLACSEFTNIPFPLSISLGISSRKNMDESMYDILKTVEDRMYQNKLLEQNSVRSSIIASLQESLAEKTMETEAHSQRLRSYSSEIGDLLGLSSSEIDELKVLSSIHDIGKIAIPEIILMKPGRLTEEEWEIIKKHPEIGYRIAQSTPELSNIAEAILCHHERWDGTGYPRGLKGEQIPLVARILTLVDSFDVMINGRPYQESSTVEEALEEIDRCSGTQFDPKLAKIFINIIKKKNIQKK